MKTLSKKEGVSGTLTKNIDKEYLATVEALPKLT